MKPHIGRRHVAFACLIAAAPVATASVPRTGIRLAADTLTALPAAKLQKPLRTFARMHWTPSTPPQGWQRLAATGTWDAAWDAATGVPRRIWGSGIEAPGSVANATTAETFARQMLASHLDLLAPGAELADFALVANSRNGDIRAVGFAQRAGGHPVVGGQVSFLFKSDRLFVIGSEAFPHVAVKVQKPALASSAARVQAEASLRSAVALPDAPIAANAEVVILPLIGDDAVLGYRAVSRLIVDGEAAGRYTGYVDLASGEVVAVEQRNLYATGTVQYRGIDRYPGRGRINVAAARAHVSINGVAATTSPLGAVTWSPDAPAVVQTSVEGDVVKVVNKAAGGLPATAQYTLNPGEQLIWDASGDEANDAQLAAYLDINIAKEYVRAEFDRDLAALDEQLVVNVNIDQGCNAFFDGTTLNFFRRSMRCENTARLQDVVFHEFGHRVHTAEIIRGVGAFDGGMSEGAADFLAATITGDSGVGRGFDFTNAPLRELDPVGSEWMWPQDIGEIHHTGLISGGIFWDLRKDLIASLGDTAGRALVNKLFIGALRYAVDIPSSLVAALAADDDDGNLANGTPHEAAIRTAFANHGLRAVSGSVIAPGHLDTTAQSAGIVVQIAGGSERAASDQVIGATLSWQATPSGRLAAGSVPAVAAGPNRFLAQLPVPQNETVQFNVAVAFRSGVPLKLPDNLADPDYQLYAGRTKPLYCTDFEHVDPWSAGWTTATADGQPSPWEWGTPSSGVTDPHTAYSGSRILSLGLNRDYNPNENSWVQMPEIDVGSYSDVRLQYWRYLAVEDGYYDHARITANGAVAWQNRAAANADASSIHHIDREWRFHDVPVSSYLHGHKLRVGWSLSSDEGLNLGGWALDDVCIVADPSSICGDGIQSRTEECDAGLGNADAADACRTYCKLPVCGDGIVDSAEPCDAGSAGSPDCTPDCKTRSGTTAGGCAIAATGPGQSLVVGALAVYLGCSRRRRRRSRLHRGSRERSATG